MWVFKENNIITTISDEEKEGYVYTDEEIVLAYNGEYFLPLSETQTQKYIDEMNHFFTLNDLKCKVDTYKQLLADSDYKAIKYAEGLISAEEYEPIKLERQSYRDEINRVEALIVIEEYEHS